MSLNGTVPNLDLKYTDAERQKFYKIVVANSNKDKPLMAQLVAALDANEKVRFKEYFADLAKVQQYQKAKQAEADAAKASGDRRMQRAAQLDTEIADLQDQKAAVFSRGAKAAVGQVKAEFRGAPSPAPAPQGQGRVVNGLKY